MSDYDKSGIIWHGDSVDYFQYATFLPAEYSQRYKVVVEPWPGRMVIDEDLTSLLAQVDATYPNLTKKPGMYIASTGGNDFHAWQLDDPNKDWYGPTPSAQEIFDHRRGMIDGLRNAHPEIRIITKLVIPFGKSAEDNNKNPESIINAQEYNQLLYDY